MRSIAGEPNPAIANSKGGTRSSQILLRTEPWFEAAQDDATRLAIGDMERAGIDIITDGEIRRERYSNRLATALSGIDLDHPATVRGRNGGT
jgi:5-methyltetrahydropteroyltriglutamate--homocysteine methyltransferase